MQALARFSVVSFVLLALVACGSSEKEKAQKEAQSLTEEQAALANWVSNAGEPSTSWTNEELNVYEGKLNRLQKVESQLVQSDGKNGVRVIGKGNADVIALRRAQLQAVREAKARTLAAPTSGAYARVQELHRENQELNERLKTKSTPDVELNQDDLREIIAVSKRMIANIDEQIALVSNDSGAFGDAASVLAALRGLKRSLEATHVAAQIRLEQMTRALSRDA